MRVPTLESSEYSSAQKVKSSIISGKDFRDDMHRMTYVGQNQRKKFWLHISCRNGKKTYNQTEQKPLAGCGWKEGKIIFLSFARLQNLIVKKLKVHLDLIATTGEH